MLEIVFERGLQGRKSWIQLGIEKQKKKEKLEEYIRMSGPECPRAVWTNGEGE